MKWVFVQPALASSNPHPSMPGKGERVTSLVPVQRAPALAYFSTGQDSRQCSEESVKGNDGKADGFRAAVHCLYICVSAGQLLHIRRSKPKGCLPLIFSFSLLLFVSAGK